MHFSPDRTAFMYCIVQWRFSGIKSWPTSNGVLEIKCHTYLWLAMHIEDHVLSECYAWSVPSIPMSFAPFVRFSFAWLAAACPKVVHCQWCWHAVMVVDHCASCLKRCRWLFVVIASSPLNFILIADFCNRWYIYASFANMIKCAYAVRTSNQRPLPTARVRACGAADGTSPHRCTGSWSDAWTKPTIVQWGCIRWSTFRWK